MTPVPLHRLTTSFQSTIFNVSGCVILDLGMPDISGLDVQESLASSETGRPVVFISGKNDITSSVAAMKNGAVDFLIKPFSNADLVEAVREALKRDQAASGSRNFQENR